MALHQVALRLGERLRLVEDRVGHGDLADVVQQEAELDLGVVGQLRAHRPREREAVGGDPLGVLAGVGVARLDRVGQRAHGRDVGRAQLRRSRPLLLERLAQIRGVALELLLLRGGLRLDLVDARPQRLDLGLQLAFAVRDLHRGQTSRRAAPPVEGAPAPRRRPRRPGRGGRRA